MREISDALIGSLENEILQARITLDGWQVIRNDSQGDEPIQTIHFSDGASGESSGVSIGSTIAASVTVGLEKDLVSYALDGREMHIELGMALPSGEEWFDMGTYTVTDVQNDDGTVTVTGMDAMVSKLDTEYEDMEDFDFDAETGVSAKAFVSCVCDRFALAADIADLEDVLLKDFSPDGCTWRQLIGFVAALYGRFARIGRDGVLRFLWYQNVPVQITADDYYEDILGLAKRVNMMIEFMRDTYPYLTEAGAASAIGRICALPGVRAGQAGEIWAPRNCRVLLPAAPTGAGMGVRTGAAQHSVTAISCVPEMLEMGYLNIPVYWIGNPIKAEGQVKKALDVQFGSLISRHNIQMGLDLTSLYFLEARQKSVSGQRAWLDTLVKVFLPPMERISRSLADSEVWQQPVLPMTASGRSYGLYAQTPVSSLPGLPFALQDKRRTKTRTSDTLSLPSRPIAASRRGFTETTQLDETKITKLRLVAFEKDLTYRVRPIPTKADPKALPADPVETERISSLGIGTDGLLPAPGRPFWPETISTVKVRSESVEKRQGLTAQAQVTSVSKEEAVLEYQYSAPGGAVQNSGSSGECTLANGWLPPVWVDGGLWIRQAYETVRREDGSLEVH